MAFFGHAKKKEEEKKSPECCCAQSVVSIKVLGAGCRSCHEMYENAQEAARNAGLRIEVEYITDMSKVMEYGVMRLPALAVNEKVVSQGQVLKAADIEKLLADKENT